MGADVRFRGTKNLRCQAPQRRHGGMTTKQELDGRHDALVWETTEGVGSLPRDLGRSGEAIAGGFLHHCPRVVHAVIVWRWLP